jgi:hypothetical protein
MVDVREQHPPLGDDDADVVDLRGAVHQEQRREDDLEREVRGHRNLRDEKLGETAEACDVDGERNFTATPKRSAEAAVGSTERRVMDRIRSSSRAARSLARGRRPK